MRKHRGRRRYYQNIKKQKENWSGLNFTDKDKACFDLWHTHFDWKGYGNDSFKRRKPHLDKLFREFAVLEEKAKSIKTEYQIWATLLDYESGDDALFLHTPNPTQDNFPWKIKDLSSKNNLTNSDLAEYVNNLSGYKILFGQADENYCVVFKDNVGVALT